MCQYLLFIVGSKQQCETEEDRLLEEEASDQDAGMENDESSDNEMPKNGGNLEGEDSVDKEADSAEDQNPKGKLRNKVCVHRITRTLKSYTKQTHAFYFPISQIMVAYHVVVKFNNVVNQIQNILNEWIT